MRNVKLALLMLFHPLDGFYSIKKGRDQRGLLPALVLFFLIMVVRVFQIYLTHFPVATVSPEDVNLGSEVFKMITPLVSWIVACYMVTTILDGKMTLKEIFTATAYSMLPYIVLTIPITLVTNIMTATDIVFLNAMNTILWAWIGILFFTYVMEMNQYGFWRSVGVIFLSVIGILIIWATVGIIITLTNQFYQFVKELILEITIRIAR